MTLRLPTWSLWLIGVLSLAIVAGLTLANLRFAEVAKDANDFLPRWQGVHAWLTQDRSPYDPDVSRMAQVHLYGRPADPSQGEDPALFAYPLPAALFYAPFGLLDYPVARALWMTLLELALALSAVLTIRLAGWKPPAATALLVLVFSLTWSPGIRAIVAGSTAPISLVLGLAGLLSSQGRWDFATGVLLALTLIDPLPGALLMLAVCAWAVSKRRWGIPAGAGGTSAALLGTSLILLPGWPIEWLRQLAGWVGLGSPGARPAGWPVLESGTLPEILIALLVLGALWSWWKAWRGSSRQLVWSAAFTLAMADWIGLMIFGRAALVYLLPAGLLILGVLPRSRRGSGSWPAGLALVVIALISWAPQALPGGQAAGNVAGASAAFCLASIALMWVRWRVTRGAEILGLAQDVRPYE